MHGETIGSTFAKSVLSSGNGKLLDDNNCLARCGAVGVLRAVIRIL